VRALALALLAALTLGAADLDNDGLDDAVEQRLLESFAPAFLLSRGECDGLPAEFAPGDPHPRPLARNGTIHAQASPRSDGGIELRYFHLWARDCGRIAHELDAERVSALLYRDGAGDWKAAAWYASAHEGTACDVSSLARAADLGAERRGPRVWISRGKHASFLDRRRCAWGCGGDVCDGATPMTIRRVVNLGEAEHPLNGAIWTGSERWQLASKMTGDFDDWRMAKLADPSWSGVKTLNVELRTAQSAILGADSTADALALAGGETDRALTTTAENVDASLARAAEATGAALELSAKKTGRALRESAKGVGRFLGVSRKP
jgi:hypothetical protein